MVTNLQWKNEKKRSVFVIAFLYLSCWRTLIPTCVGVSMENPFNNESHAVWFFERTEVTLSRCTRLNCCAMNSAQVLHVQERLWGKHTHTHTRGAGGTCFFMPLNFLSLFATMSLFKTAVKLYQVESHIRLSELGHISMLMVWNV